MTENRAINEIANVRSDVRVLAESMKEGFKRMDERFAMVDKRFDDMSKRFSAQTALPA